MIIGHWGFCVPKLKVRYFLSGAAPLPSASAEVAFCI
jgi:hypothetical protein